MWTILGALIFGIVLGTLGAYVLYREKLRALRDKLNYVEGNLKDTFKALSSDALKSNNESFIGIASTELEKRQTAIDNIVKPLKETLEKLDVKINDIEKERKGTQDVLKNEIKNLLDLSGGLKEETGRLVTALRKPHVRGRWESYS